MCRVPFIEKELQGEVAFPRHERPDWLPNAALSVLKSYTSKQQKRIQLVLLICAYMCVCLCVCKCNKYNHLYCFTNLSSLTLSL